MSHIKQLIEQDERIITCKKQSKILFKNLKKSIPEIKLMQCQIKVAQEMGFEDWFDLYNKVKNEVEQKLQLQNNPTEPTENINQLDEVSNMFETLLKLALKADATDIHIESIENQHSVKLRINGELKKFDDISFNEIEKLSEDIYYSLYHRVFNYKDIKNYKEHSVSQFNYNPYDFQQIRTLFDCNNYNLSIDYQSTPIYKKNIKGFYITVKIKDKSKYEIKNTLLELGYADSQIKILEQQIKRPIGSIVIGGVTGSGMKTTLKTLLELCLKQNQNSTVVSIADPHLYEMDNVIQIPVIYSQDDYKIDKYRPLYKSINAVKRMDADFVFIDQLKGNAPVKAYADLCFGGTNVTTTVKAKSSIDIVQQFKNFGITNDMLASELVLNVIMHQQLMPKVCKSCGININHVFDQNDTIEPDTKQQILSLLKKIEYKYVVKSIDKILIRNTKGCKHCHTGIKGKTVCAEVIQVNNVMRELILKNDLIEFYEYYKSLSDKNLQSNNFTGKTIAEHALHKMLEGIICPTDIIKNFGEELK